MSDTKEVLEIISKDDAMNFKQMATGRRFCKIGERLSDICEDEIERYNYENSKNIITKIFKGKKFKNSKNKYLIENRLNSNVRSVAADCVRNMTNDVNTLNQSNIVCNVKEKILDAVNKYENKS